MMVQKEASYGPTVAWFFRPALNHKPGSVVIVDHGRSYFPRSWR